MSESTHQSISDQSLRWCAALSHDGKRVLSGGDDLTVRLWDATTGKELHKMTGFHG